MKTNSPERTLAIALLADALRVLKSRPPSIIPSVLEEPPDVKSTEPPTREWARKWHRWAVGLSPRNEKAARRAWERAWREWYHGVVREIEFFSSPSKSNLWCEVAGYDQEAVRSRLAAQGYLTRPTPPGCLADVLEHGPPKRRLRVA